MRKCIHTIVINNWFPEMCAITIPLLKAYADRIGADLNIISKPIYNSWPYNYEKMQIWNSGTGYDWNYYIDADMIIDPINMPDFTEGANPEFFYFEAQLYPNHSYFAHPYFLRDGRNFGVSDCLLLTSSWTHDLWHPPIMNFEESKKYCRACERTVSEFTINLNIARFGLKGIGNIGHNKNHDHVMTTSLTCNDLPANLTKEQYLDRALGMVKKMDINLDYFQKSYNR